MNGFLSLFEQRVKGFRLIELVGVVLLFSMIFWVCLSKAREGEDIRRMAEINKQIDTERAAVTELKIKVAKLERPERLEAMAVAYLGMKPVTAAHEASLDSIGEISRTTSRPAQMTPSAAASAAATAAPVQAQDATLLSAKSAPVVPAPVTSGGPR